VSGAESDTPETVSAERMVEELGGFSSHPRHLARRLRVAWWVSLVPILLIVAYFVWRSYEVIAGVIDLPLSRVIPMVIDLIRDVFVVGPWFIVAYACSLAISFTVILTLRAAVSPHHAAGSTSTGMATGAVVGGILLCVGLCTLAAWASQTPHIDLSNRWWIVLGSLLPMYAVLAWIELSERVAGGEKGGCLGSLFRWVLLGPAMVAVLLLTIPASSSWVTERVFALLDWIAESLDSPLVAGVIEQIRLEQLETAVTRIVGLFVAIVVLLLTSAKIAWVRRRMERRVSEDEDEGEEAEHEKPRRGCLGRILGWFGFGGGDEEGGANESEGEEAREPDRPWKRRLVGAAAEAGFAIDPIWHAARRPRGDAGSTSPSWGDDRYDWLFAGGRPSTDQVRLIEAFQRRWFEHLTIVETEKYAADRESHADLLVEVEEGADAGDAVAACAAFACVARGQRVLMIAGDRQSQDAMVERVKARFAAFGFETLYEVSALRADTVSAWCPPAADAAVSVRGAAPDVAVATLADYEQVFLSGAYAAEHLSSVQRSLEVVIVERVDRLIHHEQVRLHLPFILDKHRLLLRTENRAMQLLMTCTPLGTPPRPTGEEERPVRPISTVARMRLANRFFGGDGGLDARRDLDTPEGDEAARKTAHLSYLRRRSGDRAPILEFVVAAVPVDAEAEGPRAQRSEAAAANLESDARGWIVRRLLEEGTVALLASGPREAMTSGEFGDAERRLRRAGLETWEADRRRLAGVRWVVAAEPMSRRRLEWAADRVGELRGATLVVVGESPTGLGSEPRRAEATFPVFPSPTSPALFVSHLRGAVGLLRPDIPIRREQFARFGLDWEAESDVVALRDRGAVPLEESWSLELDRGLVDLLRREDEIWPAIFVRHQDGFMPQPLDLAAPLDAGLCMLREGHRLRIGHRRGLGTTPDRRRFATWMTRRGLELGRSDLAYFRPVLHDGLRQQFRCLEMIPGPDGTRIIAEPLSPDGGDLVLPVRRTAIEIPPDARLRSPQSIRAANAFLFGMHESSSPCVAHERIVALAPRPAPAAPPEESSIPLAPVRLEAHGRTLVSTLKEEFASAFGAALHVLDAAGAPADDAATLAQTRLPGHPGGREVVLEDSMSRSRAESTIEAALGIRVRIEGWPESNPRSPSPPSPTDDRPRPISPVEFDLQIGVTVLAIGSQPPRGDVENGIRALYEGRWDAALEPSTPPKPRDPWHGLSRAFAYAVEQVAPSLLCYANAYAFHPPRGHDGATILLVEPMATQGTALESMTTILDDTALRERFLAAFRKSAEQGLRAANATRVDGDEREDPEASREDLLAILELLRCTTTPPAPLQDREDPSAAMRGLAVIEPPEATSLLDPWIAGPRGETSIPADANIRWRDINAASASEWRSMGTDAIARSPEYGVRIELDAELVASETAAFGHHDGLDPSDVEALRAACVRIERRLGDSNTLVIWPDYEAMIDRSVSHLREIAERIAGLADRAGLEATRERVGFFASLVQSLTYEAGREGEVDDGKARLGVQMPLQTLSDRAGDCDSVAVLLAALLRAGNVARSALVLIEEPGGGHMMAAVECEAHAGDCRLAAARGRMVMVEATNPFPIGHCGEEYHGRHVQVLAYG
jgi:hypothetical protein